MRLRAKLASLVLAAVAAFGFGAGAHATLTQTYSWVDGLGYISSHFWWEISPWVSRPFSVLSIDRLANTSLTVTEIDREVAADFGKRIDVLLMAPDLRATAPRWIYAKAVPNRVQRFYFPEGQTAFHLRWDDLLGQGNFVHYRLKNERTGTWLWSNPASMTDTYYNVPLTFTGTNSTTYDIDDGFNVYRIDFCRDTGCTDLVTEWLHVIVDEVAPPTMLIENKVNKFVTNPGPPPVYQIEYSTQEAAYSSGVYYCQLPGQYLIWSDTVGDRLCVDAQPTGYDTGYVYGSYIPTTTHTVAVSAGEFTWKQDPGINYHTPEIGDIEEDYMEKFLEYCDTTEEFCAAIADAIEIAINHGWRCDEDDFTTDGLGNEACAALTWVLRGVLSAKAVYEMGGGESNGASNWDVTARDIAAEWAQPHARVVWPYSYPACGHPDNTWSETPTLLRDCVNFAHGLDIFGDLGPDAQVGDMVVEAYKRAIGPPLDRVGVSSNGGAILNQTEIDLVPVGSRWEDIDAKNQRIGRVDP